ncbi:MAG: LPS assembly lipoprotein LptE [Vicinamibacterales bacterium]
MATVFAIAISLGGCGYSLAGRGSFLPAYIRTIAVPQFTNSTPVYDIDRRVTDRVRGELIGRGSGYRIETTEKAGVDAVMSGEISSITVTPVSFDQQQQATRYVLTMTARIEFKDIKTGKVLWSNPAMAFREEFEPTTGATITDASAFFGQDTNALDRIANEFARSVVSALLEAF